ncbi:MAG: argininosuccinate lyase [Candidatus Omnitrophica bacterium]|jgi:argininosuccinate lyase|nr:argininosuccinate lyase [Candidatus Omnitrophota bacterium]
MAKKLWGGRFKKQIDADFYNFQKSIQYDYKLAEYDIYHSMIHINALAHTGVLNPSEAKRLRAGLSAVLSEVKSGNFKYDPACEDIHTYIQNKLESKVGEVALKMHSFRSRNDQVVFDEKYYCLSQGSRIFKLLTELKKSFLWLANAYKYDYFVGYTHTQRAQIVKFSDYLLSFLEMFNQDAERLQIYLDNLKVYIGSGALAGSFIKKDDYQKAIKECADKISQDLPLRISSAHNSLNNVSNRDFIIELLSIFAILQMHLSRLAEDFILYSTREFNYLNLPEEFCTGSSLMPHKKNPDFLELVRGYTGKVYGDLFSLLTTMKGLPLTYNRDMQLDKEPLFSSTQVVLEELLIMSKFVKKVTLNKEAVTRALEDETLYATEIAEYLVSKGVPFRTAHEIVGKIIRYCEDNNIKIQHLSDDPLKNFSQYLSSQKIKKIFDPGYATSLKRSTKD